MLAAGLVVFGLVIWRVGVERILDAASQVGPVSLAAVLVPSVCMYAVDTCGWKSALDSLGRPLSFWNVFVIRAAGEAVNMTTPTGYLGGEPLKAYFLTQRAVPLADGLASVVIAKAAMIVAQLLFTIAGLIVAMWMFWNAQSAGMLILEGLLSAGLAVFGCAAVAAFQRYAVFSGALQLLTRAGLPERFSGRWKDKVAELDAITRRFYGEHRRVFVRSVGMFLAGFACEAGETYGMLYILGTPPEPPAALAICALSVLIKSASAFIPGSLGVQDGGNLLLLIGFDYSEAVGLAFALLRRVRELVWIGVGLLCLGFLQGLSAVRQPGIRSS